IIADLMRLLRGMLAFQKQASEALYTGLNPIFMGRGRRRSLNRVLRRKEVISSFTLERRGLKYATAANGYDLDQFSTRGKATADQRPAAAATSVQRHGSFVEHRAAVDGIKSTHNTAVNILGAACKPERRRCPPQKFTLIL